MCLEHSFRFEWLRRQPMSDAADNHWNGRGVHYCFGRSFVYHTRRRGLDGRYLANRSTRRNLRIRLLTVCSVVFEPQLAPLDHHVEEFYSPGKGVVAQLETASHRPGANTP